MAWWCVVNALLTVPGVRGDLGQVVSSLLASMQPSSRQVQVQVRCSVPWVLLLTTLQGGCPGRCTNLVVCSLQGGTLQQAGGCRGLLTGCCRLPSRRPPPRLSRVPRQLGWGQYGLLQEQRGRQPRHLPSHSEAAPSVRSVKRPPHPPPPGDLSTNLVPGTGARQCGVAQPVAQRRILGGAEAGRGQFPWSAVIHISSEVGSW